MASAGIPGMAGFISEFLIFRGSLPSFTLATLLSMVGSGLTAVYFLLLVNRAFFGRLAIAVGDQPNPRILLPVPLVEQMPAILLSLGVLVLGLAPDLLVGISEAATTGLSQLALTALPGGFT
jgi:NAD(P)H-quinone oxidoreductase subunit 4